MIYKEHRPNYFRGFEQKELEFASIDDLLKTDCVASMFATHIKFLRFSLSFPEKFHPLSDLPEFYYLMAEQIDGEFWVTGYIYGTKEEVESLNLPEWEKK